VKHDTCSTWFCGMSFFRICCGRYISCYRAQPLCSLPNGLLSAAYPPAWNSLALVSSLSSLGLHLEVVLCWVPERTGKVLQLSLQESPYVNGQSLLKNGCYGILTHFVFASVCSIEGCVNCLQSTTVGNYKKEHIKKSNACKNQFSQLECVQMQNL